MKRKVTVSAPATIANLGSGFDTLGVALELRNYVSLEESDEFEVVENGEKVQGDDLVVKVIKDFFNERNQPARVKITKKNSIPMKKGLGSSSAAIVSALGAAMVFFNEFDRNLLFERSVEIEGHPDNVAPAVFGGLRVSANISNKNISLGVNVPFQQVDVFVPPCEISTAQARKMLPKMVPFSDAIFNIQRVAMLLASSFESEEEISKEYFKDKLHQRKRLSLCKDVLDFFEKMDSDITNPIFVCGSGPSIAIVGKNDVLPPEGWKKLPLNVSTEGFKVEEEE